MFNSFLVEKWPKLSIYNLFIAQLKEMDGSAFDELCGTVETTLELGLGDSLVGRL